MRKAFYWTSLISLILVFALAHMWHDAYWLLVLVIPYILIGCYDIFFTTHNILRNYPVIGHLRYMFESIRPEIQQYFVTGDLDGRPYNRETRDLIYRRSKDVRDTLPFGTIHNITDLGYESVLPAINAKTIADYDLRHTVGSKQCGQPYSASLLNVSAMSYGALSKNAILALNKGANEGNFYHNSGEGGVSPYHLEGGGDLVMQFGTGYFGCRTRDGQFCPERFHKMAMRDNVKMVEIKISQGAKPGTGGLLPGKKVTPEIAEIRGISVGETCESPNAHTAFSTPVELLKFVEQLRHLSGGKPVGFKFCLGRWSEFMGICKAMLQTGIVPDFITVDGAEGGTGAAPLEHTNRLGTTINDALSFVHNCLVGIKLRDQITIIASGKVASGFDLVMKLALGADVCNAARAMMMSIGCIQARQCNTNRCPTGITTQDPWRMRALKVDEKYHRVANFHRNTMKSFVHLLGSMGLTGVAQLTPRIIYRRDSDEIRRPYSEIYTQLEAGSLLDGSASEFYMKSWADAKAEAF